MPKWKKGAREFTVGINYNKTRGYQSCIPKPVIDTLGSPEKITFIVKPKKKVEIVPANQTGSQEKTLATNDENPQ